MSEFPGSAKVVKGALIGVDTVNPLAKLVRFQYNPTEVKRTVRPTFGTPGTRATDATKEPYKLTGPPTETITMELDIDAADQLGAGDPIALMMGIHPQLASLEMMLYPEMKLTLTKWAKLDLGAAEVAADKTPLTLLFWGVKRIQPVKVMSLSVQETNFDSRLNPIQARVSVELETMTYSELSGAARQYFVVYQIAKEAMATIGGLGSIKSALIGS